MLNLINSGNVRHTTFPYFGLFSLPTLESRSNIGRARSHPRGNTSFTPKILSIRKIFTEWQMRLVSRSTYISQFPDVMAQKASLGCMRREAASGRKCRSRRRWWLRGRHRRSRRDQGRFSPPSFARTTQADGGVKGEEHREGAVDVRRDNR